MSLMGMVGNIWQFFAYSHAEARPDQHQLVTVTVGQPAPQGGEQFGREESGRLGGAGPFGYRSPPLSS